MKKLLWGFVFSVLLGVVQPAEAVEITSPFGWRIHPIYGDNRFHTGTDIGYAGGTEIPAMLPGVVEFADWWSGYGKCVILGHAGGDHTLYAHMNEIDVNVGQPVERGTVLGTVGQTGVATGPHLHLEYWKNGEYADPMVPFGVEGTDIALNPAGAVMPVYTMGSYDSVTALQKKKEPDRINPFDRKERNPDAVAFVIASDEKKKEEQHKKESAKDEAKEELMPRETVGDGTPELNLADLMRDAAYRRRHGISRPIYSARGYYTWKAMDELSGHVLGERTVRQIVDRMTDKVADAVVPAKKEPVTHNGFNM